jgi:uncharacterized protein
MTENTPSNAVISDELLSILVCPLDKAQVALIGEELVCSKCGRHFPIENGIPNMLVEEGN